MLLIIAKTVVSSRFINHQHFIQNPFSKIRTESGFRLQIDLSADRGLMDKGKSACFEHYWFRIRELADFGDELADRIDDLADALDDSCVNRL